MLKKLNSFNAQLFLITTCAMKRSLIFFIVTVSLIQNVRSQGNPAAVALPQGPPALPMFIEDISGRPYSSRGAEGIEGSPFLLDEWNWGAVKFQNGRFAKDLSLRFNVYNNQLYFKKDESQLEFVLPVHEFMIGYLKDFDSTAVIFRSGFPVTEKTSTETFFELLADGKIQLIKHRSKAIVSFKPYNQPERKEFSNTEQLYIYADGKMIKIKKEKDAILNALPQYAAAILGIIEKKNLKLKNEQSIAQLIAELNMVEAKK